MTTTLVVGGTGTMGERVVRRLLETSDATVTVLTRDPGSSRSRALRDTVDDRMTLVRGDLDDPASVARAVDGVDQVFCNTDFFATGSVLGEYRQGVGVLEAAREAGVPRVVWSSLDGAATLTEGTVPVPHYDAKAAVAAHINAMRSEEMMLRDDDGWYTTHVSILTTSPYFENFLTQLAPRSGTLPDGRTGMVFSLPFGTGRFPLIGLDDIAWFADFLFSHWQSWGRRDLAVTADALTGDEIAATFEKVTGTPASYEPMSLDALRDSIPDIGHDLAAMCAFFQHRDVYRLDRDTGLLDRLHPTMTTFEGWLRATGWDGRAQVPLDLPTVDGTGGHP